MFTTGDHSLTDWVTLFRSFPGGRDQVAQRGGVCVWRGGMSFFKNSQLSQAFSTDFPNIVDYSFNWTASESLEWLYYLFQVEWWSFCTLLLPVSGKSALATLSRRVGKSRNVNNCFMPKRNWLKFCHYCAPSRCSNWNEEDVLKNVPSALMLLIY